MAARTLQVHVRFTPAELDALEAVRSLHPGQDQADAIARLCRMECVRNRFDRGCADALRRLDAEGRVPAPNGGRGAPPVAEASPRPHPVRIGARFEHKWWTARAQSGGAPLVCEVVRIEGGDVVFQRLRPDGNGLVKEVRRHPRADFEAAHVGRWLDEHPAPSAARTVPPALRGRVGGGAGS